MIQIVDIDIPGKAFTDTCIRFSEQGDMLTMKPEQPIIGITGFNSLSIKTKPEETETNKFEKYFRCTVDGVNWGEWSLLSLEALQSLNIKENQFFDIEYRFRKIGDSELDLYSIDLEFGYKEVVNPEWYKEHYYKKFFTYFNNDSIKWALNVLQKVYKRGIVPSFIERGNNKQWGDEDYLDFWFTAIYMAALRQTYAKVYSRLPQYTELLKEYLLQKGLFLSSDESLDELYYLMNYFYDEISKRASLAIFDTKRKLPLNYENVTVRGEFSRLVDSREGQELFTPLIPTTEQGWIIGETSPLYHATDMYQNFIKGYENSEMVQSLEMYPLVSPEKISLDRGMLSIVNNSLETQVGIGGTDKLIQIDPGLSYEISFRLSTINTPTRIRFGVMGYDEIGQPVTLVDAMTGQDKTSFYDIRVGSGQKFLSGKIYGTHIGDNLNYHTPEGYGTNYRNTSSRLTYIAPYIFLSSQSSTPMYIWDVKIRLIDSDKDIFISSIPEMVLYYNNNNYIYTNNEVRQIIEKYLLPYAYNLTDKSL